MKSNYKCQVKSEKVSRYKAFIFSKNEYLNCQKKKSQLFQAGTKLCI
jgi:hypothetical protein